ncbi:radial spoke head protein 3 homolog [Spheniscus humboldti]
MPNRELCSDEPWYHGVKVELVCQADVPLERPSSLLSSLGERGGAMAHQAVEEVEPCECQQTQPLQALEETSKKMAARTFAQQVLAELGDSVLSNLCESDCPYDPIERAIETDFLPWLMAEVEKTLAEKALGRTELGCKSPNLET